VAAVLVAAVLVAAVLVAVLLVAALRLRLPPAFCVLRCFNFAGCCLVVVASGLSAAVTAAAAAAAAAEFVHPLTSCSRSCGLSLPLPRKPAP
jgi:hypothetical protein